MIYHMFSVFDSKACTWSPPALSDNRATAIRDFSRLARDTATAVGLHPNDYCLYCIGCFDTNTGVVTPSSTFDNCGLAAEYLAVV